MLCSRCDEFTIRIEADAQFREYKIRKKRLDFGGIGDNLKVRMFVLFQPLEQSNEMISLRDYDGVCKLPITPFGNSL